jgi:hypothetical protein
VHGPPLTTVLQPGGTAILTRRRDRGLLHRHVTGEQGL